MENGPTASVAARKQATAIKVLAVYAALAAVAVVSIVFYRRPAEVEKYLEVMVKDHGNSLYGGTPTYEEVCRKKRSAAEKLVRMDARYANDKLRDMLATGITMREKYAALALGYLGEPEDEALLIRRIEGTVKDRVTRDAIGGSVWDRLSDPRREARGECLIALGRLGTESAIDYIHKTAKEDKGLVPYCALALYVTGREDLQKEALSLALSSRVMKSDFHVYKYFETEQALQFAPLIIQLLLEAPTPDCISAHMALQRVTGQQVFLELPPVKITEDGEEIPPDPTAKARQAAAVQWLDWWEKNKDRAMPLQRAQ